MDAPRLRRSIASHPELGTSLAGKSTAACRPPPERARRRECARQDPRRESLGPRWPTIRRSRVATAADAKRARSWARSRSASDEWAGAVLDPARSHHAARSVARVAEGRRSTPHVRAPIPTVATLDRAAANAVIRRQREVLEDPGQSPVRSPRPEGRTHTRRASARAGTSKREREGYPQHLSSDRSPAKRADLEERRRRSSFGPLPPRSTTGTVRSTPAERTGAVSRLQPLFAEVVAGRPIGTLGGPPAIDRSAGINPLEYPVIAWPSS